MLHNDGDFFVMLNHPSQGYQPLENEMGSMAKFETEDEARHYAESSLLGDMFGFEIFEIGMGSQG